MVKRKASHTHTSTVPENLHESSLPSVLESPRAPLLATSLASFRALEQSARTVLEPRSGTVVALGGPEQVGLGLAPGLTDTARTRPDS